MVMSGFPALTLSSETRLLIAATTSKKMSIVGNDIAIKKLIRQGLKIPDIHHLAGGVYRPDLNLANIEPKSEVLVLQKHQDLTFCLESNLII
ncbi:hypothetical protein BH11CYA1_BH11CYA1_09130 [soil metagenome]